MVNIKRNKGTLIVGIFLFSLIMLMVIVGLFWTPFDPETMNGAEKLQGFTFRHLFGTDQFGRDILSRVMKGSSVTFFIASGTVFIGLMGGLIFGLTSGYYGGFFDEIIMRLTDSFFVFPSILIALVFVSIFGTGKYYVLIALGIAFIPSFTRVIRAEVLRNKNKDYVAAAKLMGAKGPRIMILHILPNCKKIIVLNCLIGFNNAVLAEASLSFLSIGVQPPDPSLGRMLSEAQAYLLSAPWCAIIPGLTIIFMILGLVLIEEGIKEL